MIIRLTEVGRQVHKFRKILTGEKKKGFLKIIFQMLLKIPKMILGPVLQRVLQRDFKSNSTLRLNSTVCLKDRS